MIWPVTPLGSLITLQRGYDLPQQSRRPGNIPVVTSSGITGFHAEVGATAPGVVTGRYGTIGAVHYIEEDYWPHNTTLFVSDFKGNEPRFVGYLLRSLNLAHQVSSGAVPGVNRNVLHAMLVPDVPRSRQRTIADVLSTYDDLIENNTRRMTLLEQAARLLYEEWFVRLRFPGREHTRVVDGTPLGWKHVPTPAVVDINPRTQLSDAEEHWWVEMSHLSTDSMLIQSAVKREGRSGSKFCNGDTLLARITPCLENGKTAFVDFLSDGEVGRGSTEFIVLRSKCLTPEFVYCLSRTYAFRENAIKSMIGSSGRQRVQESCFEKFLVRVPPSTLLSLFRDFAVPIFRQIRTLHLQNQRLRAARDLLLPRLMNGEVEV